MRHIQYTVGSTLYCRFPVTSPVFTDLALFHILSVFHSCLTHTGAFVSTLNFIAWWSVKHILPCCVHHLQYKAPYFPFSSKHAENPFRNPLILLQHVPQQPKLINHRLDEDDKDKALFFSSPLQIGSFFHLFDPSVGFLSIVPRI